jgi:hypothetical protein
VSKRPSTHREDPLYRRLEDTSPNAKARNACLEMGGRLLLRHLGNGDCHNGGPAIDLAVMAKACPWTVGGTHTIVRQRIHAIAQLDLYMVGQTSRLGCRKVIATLFEAARQFDNRINPAPNPYALHTDEDETTWWLAQQH